MISEDWYRKKSLELFSGLIEPYLHYFESLKPQLQKANINLSIREYLSIGFMTASVVFVVEMLLLSFIFSILPQFTIPMALMTALILSILSSGLIAILFYMRPSIVAKSRGEKIDKAIPFAATYLSTIAGSGINTTDMFKILNEFESHDVIAEEARKIVTNVEILGMNITQVLIKIAKGTPSDRFSKLLWGMVTTIRSGGDLRSYLEGRSRELMREHKRDLEEYSESLGTLLQVYLTLIMVGSIFAIIVTSIMSTIGIGAGWTQMITMLHFAVVFLFLPVLTAGFIWLIKTTYPG